ncbi:hypothetical protein H6F86_05600 [Phormidium sp. FACHB-592]|uniref:Uncharacterized protein n=1 Tax=Stenomitos frigidus AS-A4 TaxID=2933935 RepID=A0ABV0KP62_9CYAN|nr:hypothetical protein [Phormidium sp. FACHB-592]MBD2073366.1 hypothetical protein [Phormidium sp. FACHB-592]
MPFVHAGEASEAGRHAQSHMQTLMEMLFKIAEAALRNKDEPEPKAADETLQDAEPSLSDSLESHVERDALHDSVSRLSAGKGEGLVYRAEGFSVFRHTETMGTTYQVTTPDGEPLLTFEQVGNDLYLIEDRLSLELKQDLLAAGERLQTSDLASVLHHPNPKVVMTTMGEAAPAGTRAAWVTQQMLQGRNSFTPDHSNFQFDRDTRGNLSVTDRTNQQVLLYMTPSGQVTCTMSVEQLEQFKPAFNRLQSYETQQAAAKGVGQAAQSSKGLRTAQLALER